MKAINDVGIYKFIMKPWDDNDLKITIKRALELQRLVMDRDSLIQKVKTQEILIKDLEKKYPGISKKDYDDDD